MNNDDRSDARAEQEREDLQRRRDVKRAVGFGVVMATVQMAILLYFMYC